MVAVSLLAAACADVELGARVERITDGVADTGHPAVGLLLIGASGGKAKSVCTATVVGKHTILTATHCLEVGENTLFQLAGKLYQVTKMIRRNDWVEATSKYLNDIGLAVLDQDIPNVTPMPLSKSAPQAGGAVTLVGFGITAEGATDAGTKRSASNAISAVQSGYVTVDNTGSGVGNACKGDSGGPVLGLVGGVETVLAVISAANAPCGTKSYHVRVDAFVGWLETEAAGDIGGGTTDVQPPQVAIGAPADGATVGSNASLVVTATDDVGVVSVEALVDGASVGSRSAAPYTFALSLAAGAHQLEAVARDAAGHSAKASVTVTVDPQVPTPDGGPSPGDQGPGNGPFGSACTLPADCAPGLLCRSLPAGGGSYCTQLCDPAASGTGCPDDSACSPRGAELLCDPPAKPGNVGGSGCAVVPTPGTPPPWGLTLLAGLALLALLRRRRSAAPRTAGSRLATRGALGDNPEVT